MLTVLNLCYFYHRSHLEAFITDQKFMLAFMEAIPYMEEIGSKQYFGFKRNRPSTGRKIYLSSKEARSRTFKQQLDSILEIY